MLQIEKQSHVDCCGLVQKEEDPVWVKREKEQKLREESGDGVPFFIWLLLSIIVAIAAVRAAAHPAGRVTCMLVRNVLA
jgi:hypothetical protein